VVILAILVVLVVVAAVAVQPMYLVQYHFRIFDSIE
jgi:hypothetical protein